MNNIIVIDRQKINCVECVTKKQLITVMKRTRRVLKRIGCRQYLRKQKTI